MRHLFSLLLVCTFLVPTTLSAQITAREIMEKSIASMAKCNTLKGRIKRTERIDGKQEVGDMYFKVTFDPYKVYIYNYAPDEGSEVLYVTGWNKNKAFIHPNKFPFVNVSFHPRGGMLTKNRHHTMFDVGFRYTQNVVEWLMETRGDELEKYVTYERDVTFAGEECYVLTINYDEYGTEDYTVLEGEDLLHIDAKLRVPAYRILELNPKVKDFFDVDAGDVIKVPNLYAEKVVFFITKDQFLPIVQAVYDTDGLFEKYEYTKLRYNPKFEDAEFTTDWHEYDF